MKQRKAFLRARLRRTAAFLLFALLLSLFGCHHGKTFHTLRLYGMGTFCAFTLEGAGDASYLLSPALSQTEALLSHRIAGSFPDLLAKDGCVRDVDARLFSALYLAEEVKANTEGLFSLSVLPLTNLWRFDAENPVPPSDAEIASALSQIKDSRLLFENGHITAIGAALDLGAIGKGYACDVLSDILRARGECGLISVGGSIAAVGSKGERPWTVGVRDPFSASQNDLVGVLSLTDAYVSTSGSYEKTFTYEGVRYHHILDPRTGGPAESDLVSVTVCAESGVLSDILSTACFLVGSERAFSLAEMYGATIIAITAEGSMIVSEALRSAFEADFAGEVIYR